MTGTVKKTAKKIAVRKGSAVKTQKNTPRKRSPGAIRPKKAKKGVSPDIWQALLLTGMLIAASTAIAIGVLGIKHKNTPTVPVEPPALALAMDTVPSASSVEPVELEVAPPKEPVLEFAPEPALKPTPPKEPVKTPVAKATPTATPAKAPSKTPQKSPSVETKSPAKAVPPKPLPKHQGTLVFVIDDAGNSLQELEPFLRFPGPLTIAVLPGLPNSAEAARRIRAAGKEVFLHQPMEAIGGQNPGPGAIYSGMETAEIVDILRQNLAEVGPVTGMNNHQGSKVTMDRQIMETVLTFCHEQGINFLDSRTTSETAAPAAARNLGIKIGERNIFIDNEQNRPSMNRFIENGLALASRQGNAVMIGHTWSPDLAPLLAELYQDFITQGYTLAPASELIKK